MSGLSVPSEIARVPGHWLTGSAAAIGAAPHRFVAEVGRQHGGLARFRILNRSFVACSSVEAVRHVLVQQHEKYPRTFHNRNLGLVIGDGLLSNEGEAWLVRRRQVLPAFKSEQLRRVSAIAAQEVQSLLDDWETLRRAGQPVNAQQQAQALTLAVIGRALHGARVESEDARVFGQAVRDSLRVVRERNYGPIVPPLWWPTRANRRLREVRAALDEYVERQLDARQTLPAAEWPDDILSLLLRARDPETGGALSREALRDETKTLFGAGFETTAAALAWCLYLLARQPAAAARWRAEVDAVLQGGAPDYDDLAQLEYTAAIVQETLRLYPPVYTVTRAAAQDDEIAGRRVRRGDIMLLSIFGIHHDPDEWPEPETFSPERFLPGREWNRRAFLPFGAGKHLCVGNNFAHIELVVALALIAQHYEISLPNKFETGENAFITLTPDRDIPLQLTPRR